MELENIFSLAFITGNVAHYPGLTHNLISLQADVIPAGIFLPVPFSLSCCDQPVSNPIICQHHVDCCVSV